MDRCVIVECWRSEWAWRVACGDEILHAELIQVLLKEGIDPFERDRHYRTPLMLFCKRTDLPTEESKYATVKKIMVDLGVETTIDATDVEGDTALHYCSMYSFNPIVLSVLLNQIPDTVIRNRHGFTALDMALKCHNIQVLHTTPCPTLHS